jgi:hypothetical protein
VSAPTSTPPWLSLLQEDPIPFGPATWELKQWIGFAVYAALFLLFVYLVYRLARPALDSEVEPEEELQAD